MSLFAPANLHSVFSAQADLLYSFILDVENQTEKGIADYKNGVGSDTTVVDHGYENNGQIDTGYFHS